jgi:hypothetical protein
MKKETIEKGNELITVLAKVVSYITDLVDGRASYWNQNTQTQTYDNRSTLDYIKIKVRNVKEQRETELELDFTSAEELTIDKGIGKYISPEACTAIKYASISYRDQISAILLKEEKRLQNEFDNLKD